MASARDADGTDRTHAADDGPQAEPTPQACCSPGAQDVADRGPQGRKALTVLLFALLLVHLVSNVDPQILYQADEVLSPGPAIPIFPAYFQGMEFLKPFLAVPGGPVEYLGANLGQYFSTAYGGAAILGAVALAAFLTAGRLMALMGGREGGMLRFVPPLLLVVVWNRYTFVLADQIALSAALLAACLYFRLPDRPVTRAAAFVPVIVAFYYVAAGPCMLLAAVCGLYELCAKRRGIGAVYLAVGGLAPLVIGTGVFGLKASQAYLKLTGLHGGGHLAMGAWVGLYGFFIIMTIGLALGRTGARIADWPQRGPGGHAKGRLAALVPPVALLVVSASVALATLDKDARTFRRMCYYSQIQTWPAVILQARQYPSARYTASTCRMLNRALFEEGRLGSEMFAYPQARLGSLLLGPELAQPYKADTLLKLGAVMTAERLVRESLEKWQPRPFVLRLLVRIAIVKGDMDAARGHLRTLSRDIVHGQFAKEQLAKIDSGHDFGDDKKISEIRSFMLAFDVPPGPLATENILEALVDEHPDNRMAFEYLMAHYLLTGQLEKFASQVGHATTFDYPAMPRHHTEAILLVYGQTKWPFEELPPSPEAIETIGTFMALSRQYKGDQLGLETAVAREIPGSYFSYYFELRRLAE